MILDFVTLIFVVIVNIALILSIFGFTRKHVKETTTNTLVIDVSELITLLVIVILSFYMILKRVMEGSTLLITNIIVFLLIVSTWSIVRVPYIRDFFGIKVGVTKVNRLNINNVSVNNGTNNGINNDINNGINNDINNDTNNDINAINNKKNEKGCRFKNTNDSDVILSKYVNRGKRDDFSFEDLFPDYNKQQDSVDVTTLPDYSAYNGYPDGHICSGCECMEREDGYEFCGKFIPGMGAIGCSERWGCLNCKDCSNSNNNNNNNTPRQNTNDDSYECMNCKCHKTISGYICGKKDRTDGYVHKCKSSCSKCDRCYGADSGDLVGDRGLITAEPETPLSRVIVNNIDSVNLNTYI
jgi:hypothetical protein